MEGQMRALKTLILKLIVFEEKIAQCSSLYNNLIFIVTLVFTPCLANTYFRGPLDIE